MKKLYAIMFGVLLAIEAGASTVSINLTNTFGATATNAIKLTPVATQVQSDGTYLVIGNFKWYNTTNGIYSITLSAGNYRMDIQGLTNLNPVIFAMPSDSSTYNITNIWLSGYNIYNYTPGVFQLVNTDGSIILSPTNGKGTLTISAAAGSTNYINQVGQNLTNYVNGNFVGTNAFVGFTNSIGSAGFSNANAFQPASTNLTNWAKLTTNLLSGIATNLGTAAYSNATAFQPASSALTNWAQVQTNNYATTNAFKTFTNSLGSIAFLGSNLFQPSSANLTNWSNVATGDVAAVSALNTLSNLLGTASRSNATAFQPASQNLSNYSGLATNNFASTNSLATLSNLLGTASRSNAASFQPASATLTNLSSSGAITNILAGTNVSVTINSNTATINTTAGGVSFGDSFTLGGSANSVGQTNSGHNNAIIGGDSNTNSNPTNNVISGGLRNFIKSANGFIGGGKFNYISNATEGVIVGGFANSNMANGSGFGRSGIFAGATNYVSGVNSVILGGSSNIIAQSTGFSAADCIIVGGYSNSIVAPLNAYVYGSLAGGGQAYNSNKNTFVWSDGTFFNTRADQSFIVKASGGIGLGTNAPQSGGTAVAGTLSLNGISITNWSGLSSVVGAGFQPSSQTLTNWSLHATNDYYGTNLNLQAGSTNLTNFSGLSTNFAWPRTTALQPASQNLTNFSALTTNSFYNTNANLQAGSVQLTNFATIGTNGFIRTNLATAKGDIAVYNGTNWVRLAAGTDGYVLTAVSTNATGLGYSALNPPLYGTGSPQSSVPAYPGATYLDTATTNFYVKISGTGTTTGWSMLIQGTKP